MLRTASSAAEIGPVGTWSVKTNRPPGLMTRNHSAKARGRSVYGRASMQVRAFKRAVGEWQGPAGVVAVRAPALALWHCRSHAHCCQCQPACIQQNLLGAVPGTSHILTTTPVAPTRHGGSAADRNAACGRVVGTSGI